MSRENRAQWKAEEIVYEHCLCMYCVQQMGVGIIAWFKKGLLEYITLVLQLFHSLPVWPTAPHRLFFVFFINYLLLKAYTFSVTMDHFKNLKRVWSFPSIRTRCFPDISLGSQRSWCNTTKIEDKNFLFLVDAEEASRSIGGEEHIVFLALWWHFVFPVPLAVPSAVPGMLTGLLHPFDNLSTWLSIVSTFPQIKIKVIFSNSTSTLRRMHSWRPET